jgi:DNA-binding CsgD family transcriptional regulator
MNVNEAPQQTAPAGLAESNSAAKTILTSKELKVVELLSFGYENSDIASHFQTSKQAVKNMLRTINLKLGADNRTHAVAVCFRNGWLPSKEASDQSASDRLRVPASRKRTRPRCARRRYHDGTIDSVCTECGLVVARAWQLNDLLVADKNHICQPIERRHKVRFVLEREPATPRK